ncbi:MAG: phosphotransferase [Anaerolineae bacterium]
MKAAAACRESRANRRLRVEFGAVLKRMHSMALPDDLVASLPKETFNPKTSHIKAVETKIDAGDFGNRFAQKIAPFWREKRGEIRHIVERAETLGRQLRARRHNLMLCHSDIHIANLLIGNDGRLWIVDWDQPMLAPKERDLLFVTGVGIGGAVAPGVRGEALFYSSYGTTEIDRMALAYYRYDWAIQDIGEFGAAIFVTPDVGEETLEDAEACLRFSFTPGSVAEAARQIDDWL